MAENSKVAYRFATTPKFKETGDYKQFTVIPTSKCPVILDLINSKTYQIGELNFRHYTSTRNRSIHYIDPVNCKELPDYQFVVADGNIFIPEGYATEGILDFDTNEVLGINIEDIHNGKKFYGMGWKDYYSYACFYNSDIDKYEIRINESLISNSLPQSEYDVVYDLISDGDIVEPVGNFEGPLFIRSGKSILVITPKTETLNYQISLYYINENMVRYKNYPVVSDGLFSDEPGYLTDQYTHQNELPTPGSLWETVRNFEAKVTNKKWYGFLESFRTFLKKISGSKKKQKNHITDLKELAIDYSYFLYWDLLFERTHLNTFYLNLIEDEIKDNIPDHYLLSDFYYLIPPEANLNVFLNKAEKYFDKNKKYFIENIIADPLKKEVDYGFWKGVEEEEVEFQTSSFWPKSIFFVRLNKGGRINNICLDKIGDPCSMIDEPNYTLSQLHKGEFEIEQEISPKIEGISGCPIRLSRFVGFNETNTSDKPFKITSKRTLTKEEEFFLSNYLMDNNIKVK